MSKDTGAARAAIEAGRTLPGSTRIENRAGLIHALTEAAELEHGLLVQYLFAALSMKRRPDEGVTVPQLERMREWEAQILRVAHDEMGHLGTVCNLLTAIGGAPHFGRPNFPVANRYFPTDDPATTGFVEFTLEPFSPGTVARFVRFESPEPVPIADALVEPDLRYPTIGRLYSLIADAFSQLDEASLFIGPQTDQDTDDWSLGLRLFNVVDARSAVRAIRSIVEDGEGLPAGGADSHWVRFQQVQVELQEAVTADPGFSPARPVVPNPLTRPHFESPAAGVIDDPYSRRVSELFSWVYESMLLMLMQYYAFAGETAQQRTGLRATIRHLMSGVVRPLGEVLTELPAGPSYPGRTAGPPFELFTDLRLPANRVNAWALFHERLAQAAAECESLATEPEAPDRLAFLAENLRLATAGVGRSRALGG